jgi:hypothetical protein
LKKRLSSSGSFKKPAEPIAAAEENKNAGFQRRWVTVNEKVDKKAMDTVDVSLVKNDGKVDLEREMEKYLGGDDEVLAGFLNSDDEPETINVAAGQQ